MTINVQLAIFCRWCFCHEHILNENGKENMNTFRLCDPPVLHNDSFLTQVDLTGLSSRNTSIGFVYAIQIRYFSGIVNLHNICKLTIPEKYIPKLIVELI